MENYTKYKLKSNAELAPFIAEAGNPFIVACNKCFKEFETAEEADGDEFAAIIAAQGKKVKGLVKIDFLCGSIRSESEFEKLIPEGTDSVFAVSCGLGAQTLADFSGLPVYAAANSIKYRGQHGIALTKNACDACAQCYLNITGGICPIVDCAKSLINGPCGGAENGKCEADKKKDCAWDKICKRLREQGRLKELIKEPVHLRDYSKINFKFIKEYVRSVRENRRDGFQGGVYPIENKKFTESMPLLRFPEPERVVIPLLMNTGAAAEPVVKAGDCVKVGQIIGKKAGLISANIHSSVSGTVEAVEPRPNPKGMNILSVAIRSDGKNTLDEHVKPCADPEKLTAAEIIEIVENAGIVGMGGAGFPTHIKLRPEKPVDVVLINGCEGEPYLTADHRVLLEFADDVVFGLKAVMKAVAASEGLIVIEDNKPDAIRLLTEKIAGIKNIRVVAVKTKYPQGAEKMLIKRVLGRQVPSGKLPADVGAIVCNASSAKAVSDAVLRGMPLIERVVSVTGENIASPGNFIVKIGTGVNELIRYCGGITKDNTIIKMGGPMMGMPLEETDVPILKTTNGIIATDNKVSKPSPCIKCGRCVDVCPMELKPLYFQKYCDEENWQGMFDMGVKDCIECGCCEYICSSKILLVEKIKHGKAETVRYSSKDVNSRMRDGLC